VPAACLRAIHPTRLSATMSGRSNMGFRRLSYGLGRGPIQHVTQAYRRARPYIVGLYFLAVAAGFLYFNMRLTVEWVAIILFVAAILSGRAMLFLRDWGVFIAVLLAWQLVSPLAT